MNTISTLFPLEEGTNRQPSSAPQRLPLKVYSEAQYSALGASPAWRAKNPDFATMCQRYGQHNWPYFLTHPQKAYEWPCPRIGVIDWLYGEGCAAAWVTAQLNCIFILDRRKTDDIIAQQAVNFAYLMVGFASMMKLTEIILFLARYQTGHYQNEYAHIDVMKLGKVYHHYFLPERNRELAKMVEQAERKLAEEELERERRKCPGRHTLTLEEWRSTTPTTPFGLELEIRTPPGSTLEARICAFLGLKLPLTKRRVIVDITRQQLDMLCEWGSQRAIKMLDSWPIHKNPETAPEPTPEPEAAAETERAVGPEAVQEAEAGTALEAETDRQP